MTGISEPGAMSDIFAGETDTKPTIGPACTRSIGGIESAEDIFQAMEIKLDMEQFDCDPFLQGYDKSFNDNYRNWETSPDGQPRDIRDDSVLHHEWK